MCKKVGLTNEDLKDMTVGMCFEHIEEYMIALNPEQYEEDDNVIRATQTHFDNF